MADSSVDIPRRFPFAFDRRYQMAALPFGVTSNRAWLHLGEDQLEVRFGPWRVRTPLDNVVDTQITGPYQWFKTIGPAHLSLADRGLTFATNGDRGVCLSFARPVRGIDPLGMLRHPGLTVTVADPEGLVRALATTGEVRDQTERLADVQEALDRLHTMTASELRDLADERDIARTSSMPKAELVTALEDGLNAELLSELDGSPDEP